MAELAPGDPGQLPGLSRGSSTDIWAQLVTYVRTSMEASSLPLFLARALLCVLLRQRRKLSHLMEGVYNCHTNRRKEIPSQVKISMDLLGPLCMSTHIKLIYQWHKIKLSCVELTCFTSIQQNSNGDKSRSS